MKIFITGIFGQVGSHIAECLLKINVLSHIDNFEQVKPYHLKIIKTLKQKWKY